MLSKKQLCDRWQVSVDTVERLCKRGDLHPIKIGRLVRFREEDVDRYEADHSFTITIVSKHDRRKVRTIV